MLLPTWKSATAASTKAWMSAAHSMVTSAGHEMVGGLLSMIKFCVQVAVRIHSSSMV